MVEVIKGAKGGGKGGSSNGRRPNIQEDTASSVSTLKALYVLSEGTVKGLANGLNSVILDGTPVADESGNLNLDGVGYSFVNGSNDQDYIKGFPNVSNEVLVNTELKHTTDWVQAVSNTDLSAVNIRLKWGKVSETDIESGDVSGYRIDYAIDVKTDDGQYQEVLATRLQDKVSAGYERTHRIDLPKAKTGWQLRVRRITPNSTSDLIQDKMYVAAYTEIIDVKLNYPNSAMLGLAYNSKLFQNVAQLAVRLQGLIIQVPDNYDPVSRTYDGIWTGKFKLAYTNNPAWIYYDLCTQWRYGIGANLDPSMIDKWSIYQIAQYCDQMVDDGKGGKEPRFTCNLYLQKQEQAYTVLRNIAGIFRALSYWNGQQIVLDCDMPKDPVYTFTRSNIIGGFKYTGTRHRDRHTIIKVAWDNPDNDYQTEYEYVRDEKAIAKFGIRVLDIAGLGCTTQGQAKRLGMAALLTEQLAPRQVSFKVGLDGNIPQVGNVINVSDDLLAGRANGGRISAVSTGQTVVTVDRDIDAAAGDALLVNGKDGKTEKRTIRSINGRKITVNNAFKNADRENIWAIETADLKLMGFRVMSVKESEDDTFDITGIQYEPKRFDAIDYGYTVEPTPITVLRDTKAEAPASVSLSSRYHIEQSQTVATLVIEWDQVKDAVAYEVQWRKGDGSWITLPKVSSNSVEVTGVYTGNYTARVRAINAFDVYSSPTSSDLTKIKGKAGNPPKLAFLKATGLLLGMRLEWDFASKSEDGAYTEIQVASAPDTNVMPLGSFAYPTTVYEINNLQGDLVQYYRARIVDKIGNKSEWTDWVKGVTDGNPSKIMDVMQGEIKESHLYQDLGSKIDKIEPIEESIGQIEGKAQKIALDVKQINNETDRLASEVERIESEADQELIKQKESISQARARADQAIRDVLTEAQSREQQIGQMQEGFNQSIDEVDTKAGSALTKAESALTKTGQNASLITSKVKTLTDADQSLSESIQEVAAISGQNQTAISDEVEARSNAIESVGTRIGKVEATANGNVTRIGKLEKTTASNTEAISQARTDLTASFQKGLDDLEIGGRNLARNDFVKGRYWQHNTGDAGSSSAHTGTKDKLLVGGGGEYTFSLNKRYGYLRYPRWVAYDSSGEYIKGEVHTDINGTHKWTFTAPDNTRYIALSSEHQGSSYKYWKLEKGNKATDWTPAPEDVDASISANTALISQEAEARATALEATGKRIDVINTEVGKANTAITSERSARTKADQAIGKRVDTLQTEVNGNKSSISRIDKSIADTNESIAQAKTDLTAKFEQGIEDIEVGGRNLIKNSSFMISSGSRSTPWAMNDAANALKGRAITLSFYAEVSGVTKISSKDRILIAFTGETTNKNWYEVQLHNIKGKTFKGRVTRTLTLPSNVTNISNPSLIVQCDTSTGTIKVGDPKIEFGNKATDWSPAPEDVQAGIEANKASIVQESQARSDAISSMGQRVDGINTQVDENKTAIASETKARSDAISSMGQRVDGINTQVGNNKAAIGIINSSMTDLHESVTTARTELSAEFKKGIDDLEIGGRNLARNDFVKGRYWHHNTGDAGSSPSHTGTKDKLLVGGGGEYTFSLNKRYGYLRYPRWVAYDSSGEYIKGEVHTDINGTHKWTFTAPDNTRYIALSSEHQGSSYKYWKLEKGNKATDWTPAPEDVNADIEANKALITSESQARADAVSAMGQRVDGINTQVGKNKSSITELTKSVSDNDKAVAQVSSQLKAEYSIKDTRNDNQPPSWYYQHYPNKIAREFKYRSKIGLSGGSGTFCYLETQVKWHNSSGGDVVQTAYTDDNKEFTRSGSSSSWSAWVEKESTAGSQAKVNALKTALEKGINANKADIQKESKARADAVSAVAREQTTLKSTVGGHTTKISQQTSSINGLKAQYTVKIDNNGRVSGYGLASTPKNGTPTSEFAIRADKFYIAHPSYSSKGSLPFTVSGSKTYINNALIKDTSIGSAKIANGAITNAKIRNAAVTTAKIGNAQVDTLQIKGNAVTIPKAVYLPSPAFTQELVWSGNGFIEDSFLALESSIYLDEVKNSFLSLRVVFDKITVKRKSVGMGWFYLEVSVMVNGIEEFSRTLDGRRDLPQSEFSLSSVALPDLVIPARNGENKMEVYFKIHYSGQGTFILGNTSVVFTGVLR